MSLVGHMLLDIVLWTIAFIIILGVTLYGVWRTRD